MPRDEDWRWCPAASLLTNRHYTRWQFSESLLQAVKRRDLAIVEWIFSHFGQCVSGVEVVEEAASTGQLDVLSFLLENDSGHTLEEYEAGDANDDGNGVTWGGNAFEYAVWNGHNDVVHWLLKNKRGPDTNRHYATMRAVMRGNLPLVKLLVSFGPDDVMSPTFLVDIAAGQGHLELLQWLMEQRFVHEVQRIPLPHRDLNTIDWLIESGRGYDANEAFANACGNGPLPVVWRLAELMDSEGISLDLDSARTAIVKAASKGRLEVVKWLIDRDVGGGNTEAIHAAAINGHLEVAKYLHAKGFTGCTRRTLLEASKGGYLDVIEWLWSQFRDDPKVDLLSFTSGAEDQAEPAPQILTLVYAMAGAAGNGHLDVVKYLHSVALTLLGKKKETRRPVPTLSRKGNGPSGGTSCGKWAPGRSTVGLHSQYRESNRRCLFGGCKMWAFCSA